MYQNVQNDMFRMTIQKDMIGIRNDTLYIVAPILKDILGSSPLSNIYKSLWVHEESIGILGVQVSSQKVG